MIPENLVTSGFGDLVLAQAGIIPRVEKILQVQHLVAQTLQIMLVQLKKTNSGCTSSKAAGLEIQGFCTRAVLTSVCVTELETTHPCFSN